MASNLPGERPQRPETDRAELIREAKEHIAKAQYMKALIEAEPDYAIGVKVKNFKFFLCNGEAFITLMDAEIAEATKCINGQPNKYE